MEKNRLIFLGLALAVAFALPSLTFHPQLSFPLPAQSKPYLTYENNILGFKIDYPRNWAYNEDIDMDRVVLFFDNSSNTSFFGKPQLNVKVAENTDTVKRYSLEQLQNGLIAGLKQIYPTMKTLDSNVMAMPKSGYKAINQTYVIDTKNDFGDVIKGINYFIKFENRTYSINLNAKQEEFQKYLPIFNTMINSFKVTDMESNLPSIDTSFREDMKELYKQKFKEDYGLEIPFFMVKTDSMEPSLKINDMVTVSAKTPFDKLVNGDVIAFKAPADTNMTIISRIADIANATNGERVLTTKGDANPSPMEGIDYPIGRENYIGKVVSVNN